MLLIIPTVNAAEKTFDFDSIENIVASAGVGVVVKYAEQQSIVVKTTDDWDLDHWDLDGWTRRDTGAGVCLCGCRG